MEDKRTMCNTTITPSAMTKKGKRMLRLLEERDTLNKVIKRLNKRKYTNSLIIFKKRIKEINQELLI